MAGSAVIGALRVVLGADTAAFEDGLKHASKQMDSFGTGMARAGAAVGVAVAAAATAMAVAIKGAVNEADNLGKMAQKVGIPVEELSALKHAADLSDVSLEALGTSLGKLSKTMVEAAANPTSAAADAFRALGVSVTNADGTLKSSSQVLSDVAGKFEGLKDGAGKTAVSMAIFGKSGKDMIPLLNAGKDGLQEMKDEAAKLGIVIDTKTAKSAEAFNDNLKRLGKVKDAIILKITAGMLPSLEDMSKAMVRAANDTTGMKTIGETIGGMFVGLVFEIEKFRLAMTRLPLEWAAFKSAMSTLPFTDASKKAWDEFNTVAGESDRLLSNLVITQQTAHLADAFGDLGNKAGEAGKKLKEDFNFGALAGKDAIDKFVEATQKSIAVQKAELDAVGAAVGEKERLRVVNEGLAIAEANRIPITEALVLRLREQGNAAGEAALQLEGMQLKFANQEPVIAFQAAMANTEIAMRSVGATAEEIARAQEKVAEKFGMSWQNVGANIASTAGALSQLTGTFAKENKAMGIASKAFGIAQAVINTQIAITKALATFGPTPPGFIAVGLAIAQGAASIAAISAQGFAKGGSFMVPGGMSGTDNMMVPLNLASGERVDITPASEVAAGGRFGRGNRTLTIDIDPRSFFGKHVREIAEAMIEAQRDGYEFQMKPA